MISRPACPEPVSSSAMPKPAAFNALATAMTLSMCAIERSGISMTTRSGRKPARAAAAVGTQAGRRDRRREFGDVEVAIERLRRDVEKEQRVRGQVSGTAQRGESAPAIEFVRAAQTFGDVEGVLRSGESE